MNKSAIIIPARYNSSRFEGKPLALILGKSMIQRVYEQCLKSNADKVIVATDDQRIYDHVKAFGNVEMTGMHETGTARVAEVANQLNTDYKVIVNVQGDEPMINPNSINRLIKLFEIESIKIATFKFPINSDKEIESPNTVKVVTDNDGKALYFSRYPIPYNRENQKIQLYKHIGTYAFNRKILQSLTKLKTSTLETIEKLEQLTWLSNGFTIKVIETKFDAISVDTAEDLIDVENILTSLG